MTFKIMCFAFKVAILVSNVQRGEQAGTGVCTIPHYLSRFNTQPQAGLGSFEAKMATRKGT